MGREPGGGLLSFFPVSQYHILKNSSCKNGDTLSHFQILLWLLGSDEVTRAHLALDFVVISFDLSLRLLPVNESLRLIGDEARGDGSLLPVLLLL
jgi:hypothetical protein